MRPVRRLPLEQLQPYLLDVPHPRAGPPRPEDPAPAPQPPLDWAALFGNDRPVEIEVGFGKGLFLLNQGATRPDTNFLGVEIERKYVLLTATRVARREYHNVKLACTDARWFLTARVAADSVAAMHVYFPDPWWKTRHRKRRLFTEEFAEQVARVLKPSGRFHFVSDVQDYFEESVGMVAAQGRLRSLPPPAVGEPRGDDDYLTNFERKYRKEGRPIYRALFERPAPVPAP